MAVDNQNLYQEQTLFDQLGAAVVRLLRRALRRSRVPEWSELFKALSCIYLLGAGGLIIIGVANATRWQQYAAVIAGAVLLSGAARQFTRIIFSASSRKSCDKRSAVNPQRQMPDPVKDRAEIPSFAPDQAEKFLNEVRDAGINVKIAQILYCKGFNSARRIRQVDNKTLLSINGVGPATVSRLRARFGISRKIA